MGKSSNPTFAGDKEFEKIHFKEKFSYGLGDVACNRSVIAQLYGQAAADAFVVQYGGSMNAGNAEELLAKEHVDGGLIGGASLKAKDFSVIVKAASK